MYIGCAKGQASTSCTCMTASESNTAIVCPFNNGTNLNGSKPSACHYHLVCRIPFENCSHYGDEDGKLEQMGDQPLPLGMFDGVKKGLGRLLHL